MPQTDLIARALERVRCIESTCGRWPVERFETEALCALVRALMNATTEDFWSEGDLEALRRFVGDEQNTPALRQKPGATLSERTR